MSEGWGGGGIKGRGGVGGNVRILHMEKYTYFFFYTVRWVLQFLNVSSIYCVVIQSGRRAMYLCNYLRKCGLSLWLRIYSHHRHEDILVF